MSAPQPPDEQPTRIIREDETLVGEPPQPPPPGRGLWPWLLGLLLLVLVGLGIGAALGLRGDDGTAEPTTMPRTTAEATTEEETTEQETTEEETTTEAPPVVVPDLVGLRADTAQDALEEAGLAGSFVDVPSDEAEGTVVAQNPPPGTELEQGSSVRVNVSAGRRPADEASETVPDVVGLEEKQAQETLKAAGFEVEKQEQRVDDESQHKIVLAQDPPAGTRAARDSTVVIVVGRRGGD